LALQPDEINTDAVAAALGRLLDEPSFGQAASRLRAEIDHMPTAAAVLDQILASTDPRPAGAMPKLAPTPVDRPRT
jgi:hypothetical protein